MTTISKLLILLGSIGTSGVGCYATYNSLFSSSPQVTDQPFNSPEVLDQSLQIDIDSILSVIDQSFNDNRLIVNNDGWDLNNAYTDQYLQIDSKLSLKNQQVVINKKYKLLWDEINNLTQKINEQKKLKNSKTYNSKKEEEKKEIDNHLNNLQKELAYKARVVVELGLIKIN